MAPFCFMLLRNPSCRAGFASTTASPNSAPHFVPPTVNASASRAMSASVTSDSGAASP